MLLLVGNSCLIGIRAAQPEVERFILRGRELFDLGRWSDARHEFLQAREKLTAADYLNCQQVDFYLAACAVELGSRDAEAALLTFEQYHPQSVYANDVRFALGSYYCSVGNMVRAREYFEKTEYNALNTAGRERYDIRMGYVAFAEGDYRKAYEYFDRISNRSQYADHALYYKSYIDYSEGKYGRAKQGFETLARSDAYRELIPYFLLQIGFQEGNYRYVIEHGDTLAARATPERRAEIERIMAESWFRQENYNQTIEHLKSMQMLGGELDREGNYLMGFSLYRTTRYADAVDWLRKACGAEDELTQNASYHLADCYLRLNDKESAMKAFSMAADDRFDATVAEDALFNYAKLQYELGGGAFNGAIHLLQRYIERYPSSSRTAEARTLLIAAYYNARDYDAAYRAIKSMPSADSEIRAALQKIAYFRGLEAYKSGDFDAANRYFAESTSVGVSPKYSALNTFWQAEIAYRQADYTVAAAKYNAYLKQAPRGAAEYTMAWYNLGYCAFQRGDMTQAATQFEKFLTFSTANSYQADAYNRLGDVCYTARNYEQAIKKYDKAIAIGTDAQYYAQYQRAISLGILGRNEEKIQALRRIVGAGAGNYVEPASYELGRSYIAQERYAEGVEVLESFVATYPTSARSMQAFSDLGLAYLNLGESEKSLKTYERIVASSPRTSEAREAMQGIRNIYVSRGDVDGYFNYATKVGMESDLSVLSRDSLSFVAAQKLYLSEKYDTAAKSLRSYVKSFPHGSYLGDALYYLSDCNLRVGDRTAAIESLTALTELGQGQHTVVALEKLSSLTWDEKQYGKAAMAYRRLFDVAPAAEREAAMTGYVRSTLALDDPSKIEPMAVDVRAQKEAGATARREATFAWAEQLRKADRKSAAIKLYKELAEDVTTAEGSAAAYYVIESQFTAGDLAVVEKAVFAYSERSPKAYWLAKAYILLGDVYAKQNDNYQARATWQSVADGYSPADDGIVAEARDRISKLQ